MEILPQSLLSTFLVSYYDTSTQLCLYLLSLIFAYDSWIWRLDFFFPTPLFKHWGFPGGSDSKESTCNVGDPGSIPE